jgi:hypothetical protein
LFFLNSDLCYTFDVDTKHQIWQYWAERLHTWGMSGIAAAFLEAAGPMRVLMAQVAYAIGPVFAAWFSPGTYQALVSLFEEDQQAEAFIRILREDM